MNRRSFLQAFAGLAGAVPASALASGQTAGAARGPNIVVIVADDLGYGDLGSYGGTDIPTPNLDGLARGGVRCTDGYVTCPVCSPTRAGLITGRYQQRFGHELNPGPEQKAEPQFGLPLSEITLADRLKKLGYRTGMVGKWHLGYRPDLHPQKRGFDEFFGFLAGAHTYSANEDTRYGPILRGTEKVEEREYLTDAFAREAVAFAGKSQAEPFFLYLAFNAVHAPMEASSAYLSRVSGIADTKRRTYAAMLTALDAGVGRLLSKLREDKLEENTLLFFVSDNGGPTRQTTSRNTPLRGYKGQVFDGGIRVPYIVHWKGKLKPGVFRQPVSTLDIHPTAVAAGGGTLPGQPIIDGVNLLPFLQGQKQQVRPHAELAWRFGPQKAIRRGDWKLLQLEGEAPQLFDLDKDPGEKNDLALREAVRLQELQQAYQRWEAQMIPPRWRRM